MGHFIYDSKAAGSSKIVEHLNYVIRHRWGNWKVSTRGTETVLIRSPGHRDRSSIRSSVRVRSTLDGTDIFGLSSDLFLASGSVYFDTVRTLKA